MENESDVISKFRSFNRFLSNFMGVLDQHIFENSYSVTELKVLKSITEFKLCTAHTLAKQLGLDRSYMSRIMKRFENDELITREQSTHDSRINYITLTEKGLDVINLLNKKSYEQLKAITDSFDGSETSEVLEAMEVLKANLSKAIFPVVIRDFTTKDINYVLSQHQVLYTEEYGLSPILGDYAEKGIRHFINNCNSKKECMLIPELNGCAVGSIMVIKAGEDTANIKYLMLEPKLRGMGIGSRLVDAALDFCREKGYKHVSLDTISTLQSARNIFIKKGFKISHFRKSSILGEDTLQEFWDLDL